jgi:hypothetical protein
MTYEEALKWCMENGVTLRFWKETGAYRVWVNKVLDIVTEERILVDEMYPDQASALAGFITSVEQVAVKVEALDTPLAPVLTLVHSA